MIVVRSMLSKLFATPMAGGCCLRGTRACLGTMLSAALARPVLLTTFRHLAGRACGWGLAVVALSGLSALSPASAAPYQLKVTDARNAPLADAVVMLRSPRASARAALTLSAQPVVIEQIDREFVPRVTVLPVGSRVSMPNNDAVPHSVYSFSPAKQFEFDAYVGSSPRVLTLDKTGIVTLGCNIHDWMVGYIVVVDTPLAAQTDASGNVSFANVADGDYELRVWHPQQRSGEHVAITTVGEQNRAQTVVLDVTPPRARYKPPLTIRKY